MTETVGGLIGIDRHIQNITRMCRCAQVHFLFRILSFCVILLHNALNIESTIHAFFGKWLENGKLPSTSSFCCSVQCLLSPECCWHGHWPLHRWTHLPHNCVSFGRHCCECPWLFVVQLLLLQRRQIICRFRHFHEFQNISK